MRIALLVLGVLWGHAAVAQQYQLHLAEFKVAASADGKRLTATFSVKNNAKKPIKDIVFECSLAGETGKVLGKVSSASQTGTLEPGKTRFFGDVDMGSEAPATKFTSNCRVKSASWG